MPIHCSLSQIPLFTQLSDAQNILIAGAGGGFDIYSGLPLYHSLIKQGKSVHLANLSFTPLQACDAEQIQQVCWKVTAKTKGTSYFPEKYLSEWFFLQGEEVPVYSFETTGVKKLLQAYNHLIEQLEIDTIILVDGGTDSLMFGDEAGLGTPSEDACSMVAVTQTNVKRKILSCLGFGIDHFHGVSHHSFLENVAKLTQQGGYLGCFSLLIEMPEVQAYMQAVQYSNQRMGFHPSIVANSIVSALEGHYGDFHATSRTQGGELYIQPLMPVYWSFELEKVTNNLLYFDQIKYTNTMDAVIRNIRKFREGLDIKPRRSIPL